MNFEKYTDRARGFVESAQSLALREGHQQFAPEHLLKVLLDDPEGLAAGLIDRSGGNSRQALKAVETALAKIPEVSRRRRRAGLSGATRSPGFSTPPRRPARRPATVSSPSNGCCLRWRWRRTARPARSSKAPA